MGQPHLIEFYLEMILSARTRNDTKWGYPTLGGSSPWILISVWSVRTRNDKKKGLSSLFRDSNTRGQSDSRKSEARLAPNFANSSDVVDDYVDTGGVEDPAHPP